MKNLTRFIIERLKLDRSTKIDNYKYHPKDYNDLRILLSQLIEERGKDADLNDIDVSNITTFYYRTVLFADLDPHNIKIDRWDVSNAENMNSMFYKCENFNSDLSKWDISNVKDMNYMFYGCENFNSDLSKWNVSKVKEMNFMFDECENLKNKPNWYKE